MCSGAFAPAGAGGGGGGSNFVTSSATSVPASSGTLAATVGDGSVVITYALAAATVPTTGVVGLPMAALVLAAGLLLVAVAVLGPRRWMREAR
jgi:hypothetical protein